MDEKASTLFKSATEENDPNIRLRKIIRGCKLITDLLPNETQRNTLSYEQDLFHYLLLCLPFHKTSIALIIPAIRQIFDENNKNEILWQNLEFIGSIYDGDDSVKEMQLKESLSLTRSAVSKDKYEKALNKELINHISFQSKKEFNADIRKRLTKIKNLALDHAHELFNGFLAQERPLDFLESKLTLFKIFLLNTENNQILARVIKTLETLKTDYPAIIKSQHSFENQIAYILKKKSDLEENALDPKRLPFVQVKDAYVNVFETPSPQLPIKNVLNEYSLHQRKGSFLKRSNELQLKPEKLKIYEQRHSVESEESDDEEKIELEEHEKERLERERIENLLKAIESWLCVDDEGLMPSNSEIEAYFKSNESLQFLLNFISDPLTRLIDSQWSKKYEELGLRSPELDETVFKVEEDYRTSAHSNRGHLFYYLRSFKAASVLCIRKNLKFLLSVNDQTFNTIFNGIYHALQSGSKAVNLYHIALMLENYLLLEPNVASEHIIKVNLLENLIKCCHNPKINEILVSLIDPYFSKFNIFGEIQVKIWEWCYESNFFKLVLSLVQTEKLEKMLEEESGTTEDILQKSKQFYSVEKTELIMKQMVKKFGAFQDFMFGIKLPEKPVEEKKTTDTAISRAFVSLDSALGILKNHDWECEYVKLEELNGRLPDIDDFKGFIHRTEQGLLPSKKKESAPKKKTVESVTVMSLEPLNHSAISKKSQISTQRTNKNLNNSNNEESVVNKSTLDAQMGFTISKVKQIYPNRLCKEVITPLDKVAQKDEYKWQKVLEDERIALPAASLISKIIFGVVENEEQQTTRDFLKKRKCVGGSAIIDMFFNNGGVLFERIFLNYALKIRILTKQGRDANNSAYECGKIVNLIMRSMVDRNNKLHSIVTPYKDALIKKIRPHFDFFNKVVIEMYDIIKINSFLTQKFEIMNPIGGTRIMLFETLHYLAKLTVNDKISLINEINASIWHMIAVWFFANRLSDIFLQVTFKLIELAFESGNEDTLINILFKSNLIGSMYNAYDEFTKNEVQDRSFNIDSFLFYAKKIAKLISEFNQKKGKEYPNLRLYFKESKNWRKIVEVFL